MSAAPDLILVPGAVCENCGKGLAWRVGVGRYVISHEDGDDVCSRASVRMRESDREIARQAYYKADREFQEKVSNDGK